MSLAHHNITMNQQHPSVGVHVLINGYNVPSVNQLDYLAQGQPILDNIVRNLQLTVVNETGHQFTPTGYSYAYVLSESHFTIHTYPEHRSFYIDIFCCNSEFNPMRAVQLICQAFHTDNIIYQVIQR
jgi:S-adenosylmethionine decarboxylase